MSKQIMVSVYDSATEAYSKPMMMEARGAAIRSFLDIVSEPGSVYNKHPEHFSLFLLGHWDNTNCAFDILPSPMLIQNAWELSL